jgi:crotonobetainyl-CoA:carnitine CoA-transferase CaiB-like acyl-CoA transferase
LDKPDAPLDGAFWRPLDPADVRPLAGLRVLDFGQYIAAPAAAQKLADLGADVIKIEPPGGDASRSVGWTQDGAGPMFAAYNRGKRSVLLNLREPQDLALARALVAEADVLLHNARNGAMERLGLGHAEVLALNPRLVYGAVSGFSPEGPMADRPGYDIAGQAESGMMSLNGDALADPTRVGFAVVDVMAAHSLATGVLAALVRRGVRGQGALVEVTLIDAALEALCYPWAEYRRSGQVPRRCGNGQPTVAPAADVVSTADGQMVISAYMPEHFARLCADLGRPELAHDPRFKDNRARVANRAALRQLLSEGLSALGTDEACQRLVQAGIVCGAVRSFDQIHPGTEGLRGDSFVPVAVPGQAAPALLPASAIVTDRQARTGGALPALGQHTQALRQAHQSRA